MASTMARTSCSEALTSGRSGRTPGVSDEVLMQFLRPRIYRSTWAGERQPLDRKSTRLNSSHGYISYAVFCLKKKKQHTETNNHVHTDATNISCRGDD